MKEGQIHMRVDGEVFEKFKARCDEAGRDWRDVIREMVVAMVDNRLKIKAPKGMDFYD